MSKNFELMLLAEQEAEKSGIDTDKRPEHVRVMPAPRELMGARFRWRWTITPANRYPN